MDEVRRRYTRVGAIVLALVVGGIAASTVAFTQKLISLSAFRYAVLLLIVGYALGITVVIRKFRRLVLLSPPNGRRVKSTKWAKLRIWYLQGFVGLLVICLFYGNWIERGGPLLPRIVGSVANLGWLWLSIKRVRTLRQELG
jgi:hypothetical protein